MEWRLRGDATEPLGAGAPRGPVFATGRSPWKEVSTELFVESQLPHERGNGRSPEGEQKSRLLRVVPGECRVSRMRRTPLQEVVAGPSAQQDSGAQRTNSSTDEEYPADGLQRRFRLPDCAVLRFHNLSDAGKWEVFGIEALAGCD